MNEPMIRIDAEARRFAAPASRDSSRAAPGLLPSTPLAARLQPARG